MPLALKPADMLWKRPPQANRAAGIRKDAGQDQPHLSVTHNGYALRHHVQSIALAGKHLAGRRVIDYLMCEHRNAEHPLREHTHERHSRQSQVEKCPD